MLHIVYGTHAAREAIYARIGEDVEAKRRAYLIVPDQKVLLAERALYDRLPGSAALYSDAVGFSRLANLVCRKYGGLSYRYATEGVRVLTVYRAVRRLSAELRIYGGEMPIGTYSALAALFSEFRACRVTPEQLSEAATSFHGTPLGDKLHDFAILFAWYGQLLHENFAEAADDVDHLREILAKEDFFGDAHVYIDSFASFTGQEIAVLTEMLKNGTDVTVALPFHRAHGAHTAECADTRLRLLRICSQYNVQVTQTDFAQTDVPAALAFAKENLWDYTACADFAGETTKGELEVVRCADPNEEVTVCLREIRRALDEGHSFADIAIVARHMESYVGLLDRALKKAGIPFFLSKPSDAAAFPLVGLTLSALSLYCYNFRTDDVIGMLKTGLCGIDAEDSDLFEEYVERWHISGRARFLDGEDFTMPTGGYLANPEDDSQAFSLSRINEIKRAFAAPLSRFCDTLSGARTVRDFAEAVFVFLRDLGVREASADPAQTCYFGTERTEEAIRLWDLTLEALDTLVDAAGAEEITAVEFAGMLKLLFASLDIAKIPTAVDQVLLGNADAIRDDRRAVVILIGAVEGVFPAPVTESPTLGESEREKLLDAGVELSQGMTLRSARELYHFVRVLDLAAKRAVITYYTATAAEKEAQPSFAVARLAQIFKGGDTGKLYGYALSDIPPLERLVFPAQAVDAIGAGDAATEAVLCEVLTERGCYAPPVRDPAALSNDRTSLSPEIARTLCGDRMTLSQSRIDKFVDCPLQYHLRYGLHLEDTDPFGFAPADTGTLVHAVLEKFVDRSIQNRRAIGSYTQEELQAISDELCTAETERILRAAGAGEARMRSFFDRLSGHVALLLDALNDEFAESDFTPLATELKIGGGDGCRPLAVDLSDGGRVSLNGFADRVDIYKADGKVYLRIVDYKTGQKSFSEKDLDKGKNLQLLIYLFTLCKIADRGFADLCGVDADTEILPASAEYFVVRAPDVDLSELHAGESVLTAAKEKLERKGFLFSADELGTHLDRSAEQVFSKGLIGKDAAETEELFEKVKASIARVATEMRAGKIDTGAVVATGNTSPCRYCDYVLICRKNMKEVEEDA